MIRKLFSTLLCAFALLLLMGAGTAPQQPVTVLAEEESASETDGALETENQYVYEASSQAIRAAAAASPTDLAGCTERSPLSDGVSAPSEVEMTQEHGVSYPALDNLLMPR